LIRASDLFNSSGLMPAFLYNGAGSWPQLSMYFHSILVAGAKWVSCMGICQ